MFLRSYAMNKYRSQLEARVGEALGDEWGYESEQIVYTVNRKYTPDFIRGGIYVEVKGYFRAGDTQKYKAISESLRAQGKQFIFILQYPNKPVRKGARLTMRAWCDKFGILSFSMEELETLRNM